MIFIKCQHRTRLMMKMLKSASTWKGTFITMCIVTILVIKILLMNTYDGHHSTGTMQSINDVHSPKAVQLTNYVIEVEECEKDSDIYMLVLVGSHPDHREIRNSIRQTWGNPQLEGYRFKLVFLFGKVSNSSQQWQLQAEHVKYGDILEGDFVDSYHNVTLRDLMGLTWAFKYCEQAKYILRTDDDIALNIYKLISNLDANYKTSVNLVACFTVITRAVPQYQGRYAVSKEEYSEKFYPDYCDGWAYVLTPVVAHQIILASAYRKPFWINDVYITGMLINDLSLRHQLLKLLYTYSFEEMNSFVQNFNIDSDDEITYDLGPVRQNTTLLLQVQEIYERRAMKSKFINETH